jgi:hypothetical protein
VLSSQTLEEDYTEFLEDHGYEGETCMYITKNWACTIPVPYLQYSSQFPEAGYDQESLRRNPSNLDSKQVRMPMRVVHDTGGRNVF